MQPELELIETLYWCPETGYRNLDRHMSRLSRSADVLGFRFTGSVPAVTASTPQRVRLILDHWADVRDFH